MAKVSRFEAPVLNSTTENNDINSFLHDLKDEEESRDPPASNNVSPIAEFLKRKTRRKKSSKRDIALAAYEKQRR